MLEKFEQLDKNAFIDGFRRKFNNVLKKAPIIAKVRVIEPDVLIEVEGFHQNPIQYTFDYSIGLKRNIFNLRTLLKDLTFPILEHEVTEKVDYSQEEIEDLIHNKGYPVDKALTAKKEITKIKQYRIERVIIDRDEVFLEDVETLERKRYRLIGISLFLYGIRGGKYTKKEAGKYFFNKASFLNDIYPEKEWNKQKRFNNDTEYVTIG